MYLYLLINKVRPMASLKNIYIYQSSNSSTDLMHPAIMQTPTVCLSRTLGSSNAANKGMTCAGLIESQSDMGTIIYRTAYHMRLGGTHGQLLSPLTSDKFKLKSAHIKGKPSVFKLLSPLMFCAMFDHWAYSKVQSLLYFLQV
jgi:hypothetical protein